MVSTLILIFHSLFELCSFHTYYNKYINIVDGNDNYYSLLSDLIHCHRSTRSVKCARSGEGKYTPTNNSKFIYKCNINIYVLLHKIHSCVVENVEILCEFFLRTTSFRAFSLTSLTLRARNGFM